MVSFFLAYCFFIAATGKWGVEEAWTQFTIPAHFVFSHTLILRYPKTRSKPLTDPGFCNTNLNLVHVTVDMSLPANQVPKPQLEENEFIEVFSTPLRELYGQCKGWEREGYAIDARVGTLAEGIEVARRWKL